VVCYAFSGRVPLITHMMTVTYHIIPSMSTKYAGMGAARWLYAANTSLLTLPPE